MGVATEDWLAELLGQQRLDEGAAFTVRGREVVVRDGIPRVGAAVSDGQADTARSFGFKWEQGETFASPTYLAKTRAWMVERYGEPAEWDWLAEHGDRPLLLDAGCGAGVAALDLFAPILDRVRYLGADLTDAVDVARRRFAERGAPGAFLQGDITDLPLEPGSVDVIFSEGVLHHTDSTEGSLRALAELLAPGGRILFYVYRRKSLIREFTDDAIRAQLQELPPEEAWRALEPLTKLGIALGELGVEVDVPEDVEVLGIPAGRIDLQRLFYWHIFKAYHDPEMSFGEMQHINYDWYAPRLAHRQTPEEVSRWCEDAGLEVEHLGVHLAGITVRARRTRR
jgi:SAM-dependent methyltransferase